MARVSNQTEFRGSRLERLLDMMDAAIVSAARAVWTALVEGFAACGKAECGLPLDANFDHIAQPARVSIPVPLRHAELAGDFETIDELIAALRNGSLPDQQCVSVRRQAFSDRPLTRFWGRTRDHRLSPAARAARF